jgi:type I restriction enzyme M protein
MKKSLGNKRKIISDDLIIDLSKLYQNFEETEYSKIFNNEFFGYRKVVIEQPLVKDGKVEIDKQGKPKPDSSLRDSERIPLGVDIDDYYNREVKPHLPNSWMDRNKDTIGYEINFTKYFYKYTTLRSFDDITKDLLELEKETDGLMKKLIR